MSEQYLPPNLAEVPSAELNAQLHLATDVIQNVPENMAANGIEVDTHGRGHHPDGKFLSTEEMRNLLGIENSVSVGDGPDKTGPGSANESPVQDRADVIPIRPNVEAETGTLFGTQEDTRTEVSRASRISNVGTEKIRRALTNSTPSRLREVSPYKLPTLPELPEHPDGTQFVPWHVAEAYDRKLSDAVKANAKIFGVSEEDYIRRAGLSAEFGLDEEDKRQGISKTLGKQVVKFAWPNYPENRLYGHLEENDAKTAANALRENIEQIYAERGKRDGNIYTTEPGTFIPGQSVLADLVPKDERVSSRHDVKISPPVRGFEYKPRRLERLSNNVRDRLASLS